MSDFVEDNTTIKKYENEKIGEILKEETFDYTYEDWINLPAIIPHFLIYLNKRVNSITNGMKEYLSLSNMIQGGTPIWDLIMNLQAEISLQKKVNNELSNRIDNFGDLQAEVNKLREEIEPERDVTSVSISELKLGEKYKSAKMISIATVSEIANRILQESDFGTQLKEKGKEINSIRDNIKDILKYEEKLASNIGVEIEGVYTKMSSMEEEESRTQKELQKLINALNIKMTDISNKQKTQKGATEELKQNLESMNIKSEKMKEENLSMNSTLKLRIKSVLDSLKDIQTKHQTSQTTLETRLSKDEEDLSEALHLSRKLQETFEARERGRMKAIDEVLGSAKEEMMEAVADSVGLLKEQFEDTRQFIVGRMEKREEEQKHMERRMDQIKDSFDCWSIKVLKPMQFNEARLFSCETRLKEEETYRMQEGIQFKDTLKKLIYALEQLNANTYTNKMSMLEHLSDDEGAINTLTSGGHFPKLMGASHKRIQTLKSRRMARAFEDEVGEDKIGGSIGLNQSMVEGKSTTQPPMTAISGHTFRGFHTLQPSNADILFMKRLNFLKASLVEGKRPFTTSHGPNPSKLLDKKMLGALQKMEEPENIPGDELTAPFLTQPRDMKMAKQHETFRRKKKNKGSSEQLLGLEFDVKEEKKKHGTFRNYMKNIEHIVDEQMPYIYILKCI